MANLRLQALFVFKDPWLKDKSDFCVEDSHLNVVRNDSVCSYFRPNSKVWDVNRVQQDFHIDDVHLICQTGIPQEEVKDRVAWVNTTTGGYTVKSGYQFWANRNMESSNIPESKGWSKLWNLRLPHKVRTFLWHFCQNNVPVRKLLRSRGVALPIICSMCDLDIEHLLHVFFDCGFAKECWQGMELVYNMQEVEFAPSWLMDRIINESAETLEKIATVLWGVWFARNQKVWEGKVLTATMTMELSGKQIKDWQAAMSRKESLKLSAQKKTITASHIKWKTPAQGYMKLNVDASLFRGNDFFSIGMLIRNEVGDFVKGKTMKLQGSISVLEAEVRGIHEALNSVEEMGMQDVVIENDSELAVKALKNGTSYFLELGHVMDSCIRKLENRVDLSLCHVKKQANKGAHVMARVPVSLNCSNVFESPLSLLLETLSSDISS